MSLLLVSRPAPRGRAHERPTGPRSRGDLPTGRAVEDAAAASSAPAVRRRRGIGLVRRGRDRVRRGAASSVVFGASYPFGLARRWRQATYPCWMRADGVPRPLSGRESTPWCCLAAFLGRVGAAASPAASATHTKWPLSAGAWFAHVGARIGASSALFSRKFKTAHARQL